jgi:hypothetical protein
MATTTMIHRPRAAPPRLYRPVFEHDLNDAESRHRDLRALSGWLLGSVASWLLVWLVVQVVVLTAGLLS